jgi:hypothetical protein
VHVEQRQVTTIDLHDGKARDFVVVRDSRGCKVSGVARDEVVNVLLSYQDFQRLCQTLAQPSSPEAARDDAPAPRGGSGAAPPDDEPPAGSTIRVEQRQVTTVSLHPSRARDFVLSRDERGYQLSSVSRDEVVTVLLGAGDFHKLRRQVAQWEWRDVRRDPEPVAQVCEVAVPAAPEVAAVTAPWVTIDWLGFN